MKYLFLVLVSLFLITAGNAADAQCCNINESENNKTQTITTEAVSDTLSFKVLGSCGMCKARIEKAALSVDGVSKADWSSATGLLTVSLSKKVSTHEIHKAVAKVGHDTEKHKADNSVYNKLPGCCKYKR